ncbi:hypothetical protein ACSBR1_027398 [Camellia fascicularis]
MNYKGVNQHDIRAIASMCPTYCKSGIYCHDCSITLVVIADVGKRMYWVTSSGVEFVERECRSQRKRNASNVENLEPATAGQEIAEGKKALYHCNYCNKDISGMIRIKCVMCPDFDLCVECFSVGAELTPHKSNHPYRVMDNLSFPLICSDWNADEEILLLEGIEMYGLGNWTEVAEHVGTKSKAQCIDHYNAIYMNSPCFPLPDMSHVMGKNREELLAMAKEHGEVNKGFPTLRELTVNEELLLSARIKVEDQRKEGSTGQSSSSLTSETGAGVVAGNTSTSAVKRASQIKDDRDDIKMEDSHADRSIGEKKLRTPGEEGPSMTKLSGYNPKRREFELEYDHDAEQLLADMEFKESDTDAERELKLRVLRIYLKRLDERKRRKDFVLERNLLYPDPFEKNLSPEEREICQRYRAEKYNEEKRKKEAEESARKSKDSAQAGPSDKFLQRAIHLKGEPDSSPRGNARGLSLSDSISKDSSSTTPGQATSSLLLDSWDVNGFLGADLLSESEKRLCSEIRILPSHYLSMLQTMSVGILNGNITTKSDAHGLFKAVDPSKVDRVYDMLVKKGIGSS